MLYIFLDCIDHCVDCIFDGGCRRCEKGFSLSSDYTTSLGNFTLVSIGLLFKFPTGYQIYMMDLIYHGKLIFDMINKLKYKSNYNCNRVNLFKHVILCHSFVYRLFLL